MSADWAMRWIGSDATFAERLVAFAAVEVSNHYPSDSGMGLIRVTTAEITPISFQVVVP